MSAAKMLTVLIFCLALDYKALLVDSEDGLLSEINSVAYLFHFEVVLL